MNTIKYLLVHIIMRPFYILYTVYEVPKIIISGIVEGYTDDEFAEYYNRCLDWLRDLRRDIFKIGR